MIDYCNGLEKRVLYGWYGVSLLSLLSLCCGVLLRRSTLNLISIPNWQQLAGINSFMLSL